MHTKDRSFKSIRRKLMYAYGLLMFSLIVIFFGLNILITSQLKVKGIDNLIEESIDGFFRNIESLIKGTVNQYLLKENEKYITLAESYNDLVSEGYITREDAQSRLRKIIASEKIGESGYTYVMSYEGIMIEHPVTEYVGRDFGSDPGYKRVETMQNGYIEYQRENPGDTEARDKILYMNRFEPWNWIIAATAYQNDPVISHLRLAEIGNFINSKELDDIDCISILDSRCEFLIPTKSAPEKADQFKNALKLRFEELKKQDSGHIIVSIRFDGGKTEKAIVYFKYIPLQDWMLIAAGPRSRIYAPVINAYSLQFAAIFIAIIMLFVLTRLLAVKLTLPLKDLVRILDLNSGGELSQKADIRTGDEFEVLSTHFNNFIDRQNRYIDDISTAQKSIRILAKFPDENPNPIIRLAKDGTVEYANKVAEEEILDKINLKTGDKMPTDLFEGLTVLNTPTGRNEYSSKGKIFSFSSTLISEDEGLYLHGRDITRQKRFESMQLVSDNIFRNSIEGIVITDRDGLIETVNPAFTQITGYSEKEAVGQNPRILKSHRHSSEFYSGMWNQLYKKGFWEGEIWNRRKNGEVYPEFLTISSIWDESGELKQFISFFHDLSDVKEKEEKIVYESTHDQLTGLPNRVFLIQHLSDIIINAEDGSVETSAVVYMDINNFKRINESLGPDAGDKLLVSVAARLGGVIDSPDMVFSVGSDEFVFVFTNRNRDYIQSRIDSTISIFKQPFLIREREIHIEPSIGIALFPEDGHEAMALVGKAESAMLVSKKDVNSLYTFYTPGFKRQGLSRLEIETGLKKAFAEKEFFLNYQPKVSVETGEITGAEALVRVSPIEGQYIGPDVFIPVAEEIGLIEPLGAWVLEKACTDLRNLMSDGFDDFIIAVNLSPWQFRRAELPEVVQNIISHAEIPPANLNLEITESMAINNVEESIRMMHRLTDIGLTLSIDDFGTGYSSLSYLSQFPVEILKIDKAFVVGIPDDPKKVGIVQAILSLAENLGMQTVAEGVETEEQYRFLKDRNCRKIQGYYFYKPMPIEELRKALQKRK